MRVSILLVLLVLCCVQVSALNASVLNIQSGVSTTKGYWQYATTFFKYFLPHSNDAVARAGEGLSNQDVVLLSEIDGGSWRTKGVNQVLLFSEFSGLDHSVFFSSSSSPVHDEGLAVVSRYPIVDSWKEDLGGSRFAGIAVIDTGEGTVTIVVTHLSLREHLRSEQFVELDALVSEISGPIILGGDFNVAEDSEFENINLSLASDCRTFPSWNPSRMLDAVFVSDDFSVESSCLHDLKVSDHLPVTVSLR